MHYDIDRVIMFRSIEHCLAPSSNFMKQIKEIEGNAWIAK